MGDDAIEVGAVRNNKYKSIYDRSGEGVVGVERGGFSSTVLGIEVGPLEKENVLKELGVDERLLTNTQIKNVASV